MDCNGDQGALFSILNRLLHRSTSSPLPATESNATLAQNFGDFFLSKIAKIQDSLQSSDTHTTVNALDEEPHCLSPLEVFEPVTPEDLRKLISAYSIKACPLDPLPARVFKSIYHVLLPVVVQIINLSLSSGSVPLSLKEAMIFPTLKKPQLDCEELKNYRPVSNLPYISKLIERVVAIQLTQHMSAHSLMDPFQSAYRQAHSTETALTIVANDILHALDRKSSVFLVLLDLSAAFDTVDHSVLLQRLSNRIGRHGMPLRWVESYLSDRTQFVSIGGERSSPQDLAYGVPQGSVLGPIFFTIYTLPIGDIVRKYNMSFHLYADDTQLYMTFDNNIPISKATARCQMECCIDDIRSWMHLNKLKLNGDKTEFLHFNPDNRHSHSDLTETIKIGADIISTSSEAKNLGVIFDSDFTMNDHITAVCKSANYQLYKISHIKKYLTPDALKTAIHSLVASKIDYCNSLLSGLPKYQIARLQHIMNCEARLISSTCKFEHITPVLKALHWLPVEYRILFKIACMAYKALEGQAPAYLSKAILRYEPTRSLRSSSQSLLVVPKIRTKK